MSKVMIPDADGTILVRDGILLSFFFKVPFHEISSEAKMVFDAWLAVVPSNVIKWAEIGGSVDHASEFTSKTIARCRAQLDPTKAVKREISCFRIMGEEEYNASYQFDVVGNKTIDEDDYAKCKTNMIEMRFPIKFIETRGIDAFMDMAVEMARLIRYDSGYASLSLNWAVDSTLPMAAQKIVPLALRHPGYDVHMNDTTRYKLGRRSRGARWLTFLGDSLVAKLGGREALAQKLDPAIQVLDAGAGIAIRAGAEPLPGDVNRKDTLPLICSVARAIEPVTYFKDKHMLQHMFDDDDTRLERWERRFLKDDAD